MYCATRAPVSGSCVYVLDLKIQLGCSLSTLGRPIIGTAHGASGAHGAAFAMRSLPSATSAIAPQTTAKPMLKIESFMGCSIREESSEENRSSTRNRSHGFILFSQQEPQALLLKCNNGPGANALIVTTGRSQRRIEEL